MTPNHVFIVAEAGVNHNGSRDLARQLIHAAAQAGADCVKFQTFKASRLVSRLAPKAEYQTKTTDVGESQLEMLRKLELSPADHEFLIEECQRYGIEFLSTPFEVESLKLLTETFGLKRLKIPSGELTNGPFLLAAAQTLRPIILSTGMATLQEIKEALGVLAFGYSNNSIRPSAKAFEEALASGQRLLREKVTLLHCTTEYPAPLNEVNLRAMDTMREAFGLPVGYSDHTPGILASVAAAARGAAVIEKHFTMDKNLEGPDHQASLTPQELKELVSQVRQVERLLGSGEKKPAASESKNIAIARKSLVAACEIKAGESFSENNLTAKRPGSGKSPMLFWDYLQKSAQKVYQEDELI